MAFIALAGATCSDKNIRRIPIHSSTCREIRIVERAGSMSGDALAAIDAEGRLVLLSLPRELAAIQDVLVSPGKDLALVVSVGEGHPWINLYRIGDWLAAAPAGSEGIEPRRSMDPYPFAWTDIAWRSGSKVGFRSAGDYNRFTPATRRPGGDADGPLKAWVWDTTTDTIVPDDGVR
jgi:hypothetical protein